MANFSFLEHQTEYALFSSACIEAERVLASSPAMAAVGARKALELGVKWVYSADSTMQMPYKENLQSLIHEPSFRLALDYKTWRKLPFIIKLGNLAVHTEKQVSKSDAMLSLAGLFEFIEWIDYCYGANYEERKFSEALIPAEKLVVDEKAIKEHQSIIAQKDEEIARLQALVATHSKQFMELKATQMPQRSFTPDDISEFVTRKKYIDVDLKLLGWVFEGENKDCIEEYPVVDMAGVDGQAGFVDYVLLGKDGLPLAVVEAKRTSKDPNIGRQQCKLYADAIERKCKRRPLMFCTNGFETYFWDDLSYPQRQVSGIFSKSDLEKLITRRDERRALSQIVIDDRITDRYYQKEAIRAVCDNIATGHRKSLLVMATGTGKTRTASSLTDVLSRGGHITNVLFLADRTALVKQAKDDFKNYLPDMSLCNLLSNKDDKNARIVFSTYPTILNSIDTAKSENGQRLFTPAHFDLIIVDEAHRSIFKKYRAIFDYFDSLVVGLTATPKTDVDRNTYDFFEIKNGVPTYAYDYETAVETDHVLVPYYNIEVEMKFLEEGIVYEDLSDEDKQRYEEDFTEDDGGLPDSISPSKLNEIVFNEDTIDMVLQDLMTKGIKVKGGDRIGKTIVFAQNKKHAQFILERFDALYPQYKGDFARRIVCEDSYAQTLIDDFKQPDKLPQIAVSVDMMDTGIDVPEVLNLVFFKKVRSKTKFWQMIGRGTRLCKGLECIDSKDGTYADKRRFYIFDYCRNFEFFRTNANGIEGKETQTLSEAIFAKQVRLVSLLQEVNFGDETHQGLRKKLVAILASQVAGLNTELVSVRLHLGAVEKFKVITAFERISEQDKYDLIRRLAPLVFNEEQDEYAKRFDNFMYGLMLASFESASMFKKLKAQLCNMANDLAGRTTIAEVKAKLPLITAIPTDEFWENCGLLDLEQVRFELRGLIQFIVDEGDGKKIVCTDLADVVLTTKEGESVGEAYTFEDYRLKVNRYIEQHKDSSAILKLRNNIKLTESDYQALSDILTKELGSEEDYKKEYGDMPFGLMIRKIAKLEYEAAMQVFSGFINEQGLNHEQIVFVRKIVDYVVQNGYIESATELMKPPFDTPQSFMKLFGQPEQTKLVALVNLIKENALVA
ncbi:DEAD/DEAH box helicase family protein [Helicobacter sp. 11S02596-1]|uniref:DEAD/DEAH box helicase family protein n=1 Tax=Helicobacter sp. 11S02596-1 TaxID=1476194 RepID=UPI000BA6FFF5|nr:DEAD/DEAH box helicase family protein [Helicobacter sp. 11S02596-1]PAF45047.1 DEAD/DEAH box helicase [Helicobacter sp. 11S02596-1]